MLPNDAFESRARELIASLEQWAKAQASTDEIDIETAPLFWRLAVTPCARHACPIEVAVHPKRQSLDVRIAEETYEGLGIETMDVLLALCRAVEQGRVITRRWSSLVTGAPRSIETRLHLADGSVWQRARILPGGSRIAQEDCQAHDRHYTAWARPSRALG